MIFTIKYIYIIFQNSKLGNIFHKKFHNFLKCFLNACFILEISLIIYVTYAILFISRIIRSINFVVYSNLHKHASTSINNRLSNNIINLIR